VEIESDLFATHAIENLRLRRNFVAQGFQLFIKSDGLVGGTVTVVTQWYIDSGGLPLLMSRGLELDLVSQDRKDQLLDVLSVQLIFSVPPMSTEATV
jgi:hypothetical protein